MSTTRRQQLPIVRSCGPCRLCCTLFPVHPLHKAAGHPCRHENLDPDGPGCAIVGRSERPDECGLYACAWLSGLGSEADRPDAIGYLWNIDPATSQIIIKEAWKGASQTEEALEFFDILATRLGRIVAEPISGGDEVAAVAEETP